MQMIKNFFWLSNRLKLIQNREYHLTTGRHGGLTYKTLRRFRRVGHLADRTNLNEVDMQKIFYLFPAGP